MVASRPIRSRAGVSLAGTLRFFTMEVGNVLEDGIRRVADGVARMLDVSIGVEIKRGVSPTANSRAGAELAAAGATEIGATLRRDLPPTMASEDFGWLLEQRPGAFAWIGNGMAQPGTELHTPGYDYNDAILPVASGWLAATARRALAE